MKGLYASRRDAWEIPVAGTATVLMMLAVFGWTQAFERGLDEYLNPSPTMTQADLDWCPPNASPMTKAACGTRTLETGLS